MNPTDAPLKQPLGARGPPGRRHHATINPKDFGNTGPPTRGERPIRYTVQESEPSAKVLFLRLQASDPMAVRLGYVVLRFNWVFVFMLLSSV